MNILATHEHPADSRDTLLRLGASSLAANLQETARNMRDSVAGKLKAWTLTLDNIRDDLAKIGEIMRRKAIAAIAGGRRCLNSLLRQARRGQ